MSAYYNNNDPHCAAWLTDLIDRGLLPAGDVDSRSITEVTADDINGYTQVHLFAGIGGWPHALRLAGWPDDRPVWTASVPCQPLSSAGLQRGHADERHLWPAVQPLIAQCRPPSVFGEQVASKLGREWLAGVRADLEAMGYACGAADLCAASVGAPHIRQRLWWGAKPLAGTERCGLSASALGDGAASQDRPGQPQHLRAAAHRSSPAHRVADSDSEGSQGHRRPVQRAGQRPARPSGSNSSLGHTDRIDGRTRDQRAGRHGSEAGDTISQHHWDHCDLVWCRDKGGCWRRVEPGTFPLADGVPGRVAHIRGYGNAIVPQLAAAFIEAFAMTDHPPR